MAIFKGAGVAIVTPMKDNFEINYEQLEENINYQIDNGTDCIVITGTTGESSTLTEKEHLDAIKAAVGFAKHRVPVVAGTGSNCTKTAINMSKEADSYGVDGLLIVTPYYNKATQGGLVSHYTQIAREVKAPIIMYNVPSRTGCNLMPATVAELVKNVDNIVGIKDATGNLSQAAQMMNLCDGNLELYSGNDDQVLPLLSLGGLGVISVLSNIAPRQTHDMVMEYLEGDRNKAMKIQLDAIPLINALFCEVNPIPVKAAMNMLGMGAGPLRAPLSEMTDANKERLAAEMKKFGLM
ncbi:MAG TPA: 4-hydroxy-tetrahydrodipicolinate synthase [Candidatus Eubacterium avistercoris]|uniref:4-hydroxy-tetrahydrodipicolinate synthase n=1 Tax=Candidatus Eubacterium avistercoris TaxID=2838567 RepID=A0A9D2IGS7_9FIRM|nr:4-hydroxy-tetrahydrodipicolinate synthase [Candidatus Eubacterium avistercoris]